MALNDLFGALARLFGVNPAPVVSVPDASAPDLLKSEGSSTENFRDSTETSTCAISQTGGSDWLSLCRPLTETSESCRLTAYPDPASGGAPWTIGWGATGAGITQGTVWTQEQADSRLTLDLNARADIVDRYVKVLLTPAKKAALVDFVFNVGEGNFASSTLLKKLSAGDYQGAADEFPKWNLASGKVMPGLVTRRARERDLFLTGKWS
ncbi:TPA: lysozyme [Burkholderia cenocepacia]